VCKGGEFRYRLSCHDTSKKLELSSFDFPQFRLAFLTSGSNLKETRKKNLQFLSKHDKHQS
jgi:hypothetical protein